MPRFKQPDTGPTPAPEQLSEEDAKFLFRLRLFCGVVIAVFLIPVIIEAATR